MKALKAAYNAFVARLDLHAAELRTGVTLIEAVKSEQMDVELQALGISASQLKESAVMLAKLGISDGDDIHAMVQSWYAQKNRWRRLAMEAERYANE